MFMTLVASGPVADMVSKRKGTVTYLVRSLQVLEMNGRQAPQQPKQWVLISLIAIRPDAQPDTLMVGDVSQNYPRGYLWRGGDLPVQTWSSLVWAFQAGQALRTHHMAALMGIDLSMVTFSAHMSEAWLRQRLGSAVHVPKFGMVLTAALAPPLRACIG